MACKVSAEKSADSLMGIPLYITSCFSILLHLICSWFHLLYCSFQLLYSSALIGSFLYLFVEVLTVFILLPSLVSIFMGITLNTLPGWLLMSISLVLFLKFCLVLSFGAYSCLLICFCVLGRLATSCGLEEVALCRRFPVGPRRAIPASHQSQGCFLRGLHMPLLLYGCHSCCSHASGRGQASCLCGLATAAAHSLVGKAGPSVAGCGAQPQQLQVQLWVGLAARVGASLGSHPGRRETITSQGPPLDMAGWLPAGRSCFGQGRCAGECWGQGEWC